MGAGISPEAAPAPGEPGDSSSSCATTISGSVPAQRVDRGRHSDRCRLRQILGGSRPDEGDRSPRGEQSCRSRWRASRGRQSAEARETSSGRPPEPYPRQHHGRPVARPDHRADHSGGRRARCRRPDFAPDIAEPVPVRRRPHRFSRPILDETAIAATVSSPFVKPRHPTSVSCGGRKNPAPTWEDEMEHLTGVLGVLIPLAAIVLGIGVAFWSIYWTPSEETTAVSGAAAHD